MKLNRRGFLIMSGAGAAVGVSPMELLRAGTAGVAPGEMSLEKDWFVQSSVLVNKGGEILSGTDFAHEGWYQARVPSTVLNALAKNGVYPDPRTGLNSYRIPDSSDDFNRKYDLAKYSHLPEKRNPWRDPYWYRTEFSIPEEMLGKRLWLVFKGINYRADVWLNGRQLAGRETMAGMYQRFFIHAGMARPGTNCLAVKVYPVDHPCTPGAQLKLFGPTRDFTHNDIMKDVTFNMSVGYDCMLPQPDRNLGLWQGVSVRFTGPVDIRNPFVITDLPLPETNPARLTISADLVNATTATQSGVVRGAIPSAGVGFQKAVTLSPRETEEVSFSHKEFPQLIKRVWARGGESRDLQFQTWIDTPGRHSLQLGTETATIEVGGRSFNSGARSIG